MSSTETSDASPITVSALPFLQPSDSSVWRRANQERDRIHGALEAATRRLGVEALVRKSQDFDLPGWVSMHAWMPLGKKQLQRRVGFVVELHVRPHHRFPVVYLLKYFRNNKERQISFLHRLTDADLTAWAKYLLQDGPRPNSYMKRLREGRVALWLKRNKIDIVRKPYFNIVPFGWLALAFGAAAIAVALLPGLSENRTMANTMWQLGLLPYDTTYDDMPRIYATYGGVAALFGGLIVAVTSRRKIFHISSDRPDGQPRHMRVVDSWSTLLPRVGHQEAYARQQFLDALGASAGGKRRVSVETISYVTTDGLRQRDQIVLSEGRALVFCHIYRYESDLMMGWDSHLNRGEWVEQKLAKGIYRGLGKHVVLNTVVPGQSPLNEYDLIDLNSLSDWAHSHMTRVVRLITKQNEIDEEIDFSIIRGDRTTSLNQATPEQPKRSRFRKDSSASTSPTA